MMQTPKPLFSMEEILYRAYPVPEQCGVYFLIQDREVVYVGQSRGFWARIGNHLGTKKFNRVAFVACDKGELELYEAAYIDLFNPRLNAEGKYAQETGFTNWLAKGNQRKSNAGTKGPMYE